MNREETFFLVKKIAERLAKDFFLGTCTPRIEKWSRVGTVTTVSSRKTCSGCARTRVLKYSTLLLVPQPKSALRSDGTLSYTLAAGKNLYPASSGGGGYMFEHMWLTLTWTLPAQLFDLDHLPLVFTSSAHLRLKVDT